MTTAKIVVTKKSGRVYIFLIAERMTSLNCSGVATTTEAASLTAALPCDDDLTDSGVAVLGEGRD